METQSQVRSAFNLLRDELVAIYHSAIIHDRSLDPVSLTYAKGRRVAGVPNVDSFEAQYVEEFVTEMDTRARRSALHRAGRSSDAFGVWRRASCSSAASQPIAEHATNGAFELLVNWVMDGNTDTEDILDSLLEQLVATVVTKTVCCTYFGIEPEAPFVWDHSSCRVEIRKPTGAELERRYKNWGYARSDLLNAEPTATIVVTVACPENRNQPLYESLDRLIASLTLLRGWKLWQCAQWFEYDSLVMQEGSLIHGPKMERGMRPSVQPLPANAHDVLSADLNAVFEKVKPLIEPSGWMRTCLDSYKDAIGVNRHSYEPISDHMRCLEALLLSGGEDEGITKSLKQRTALIADLLGLDFTLVRECIGLAYSIRSKYVHGDGLDHEKSEKLQKLAAPVGGISEISRKLLLIVAMLQYKDKKEMRTHLLDSMACLQKHQDLAERIRTQKDSVSCL